MIAQLGQLLAMVPDILMQGVAWVFGIWLGWAIWTVLMCSMIYIPAIFLGVMGIKSKFMDKVLSTTIKFNAIAATFPVSLPIWALAKGVPYLLKVNSGGQNQRNRQRRGRQPARNVSLISLNFGRGNNRQRRQRR